MKIIYKLLFFIILIPKIGFAIDEKYTIKKEKTISKTFEVDNDANLEVANAYGNINVYLWDENKISIQVNIKVSGNNEKKVTERLSDIEIDFDSSQNLVNATTELNGKNWTGNHNLSYEINYTVKIPKNGNINLSNKYGNITIEKLNGSSTIKCQYGSLFLGQFNNKNNNFDIAYSQNSTINTIDKLNLKSQYSEVEFQKVNSINIDGNYNTFEFQNVGNINISSNYSKIRTNTIQKVAIEGNYLTLKFGEITNSLALSSNYSDLQFTATNKTDAISIVGNYTNSKITCNTDYAFNFKIDLKYGSLKNELDLKFTEKSEKNTSKSFTGYYLTQGKSKLNIATNYGSVQLLKK